MGSNSFFPRVGAVVLAAGQSRRMGSPKMVLPWGSKTVISHILDILLDCGVKPVVVVTGGAQEAVQQAIGNRNVILTHNSKYAQTEMLESLKIGLLSMPEDVSAILVVLGDQPQIQEGTVKLVINRYLATKPPIVVPSFQMRRGHPWLVDRSLWKPIQNLNPDQSMRDFLKDNADQIDYLIVNTPTILGDLDTPQDYENQKPG